MNKDKWRTVVIESHSEVSYKNGNIIIKSEMNKSELPVNQIKLLLITTLYARISVYLINKLIEENVKIIFCDEKKNPCCELMSYCSNTFAAGNIQKQILWTAEEKALMWKKIIEKKIQSQIRMMQYCNIVIDTRLYEYMCNVSNNDKTNREGQAARLYFNLLFGTDFTRDNDCCINAALNYGYSILLSLVNQIIVGYGYITAIGIRHCCKQNSYNLSCDLMEVFRPCIDNIVYKNKNRIFDNEYKNELISFIYKKIKYNGKCMETSRAIELYVLDVLKNMCKECFIAKEIDFI